MNLEQMIKEVNKDLDDSLDAGAITEWFNRALDDLTPITKKEARHSVEVAPIVDLPENLFEIAFILVNGEEFRNVPVKDRSKKGYKVWGNELTIQNGPSEGSIDIYYYKRLAHLEESTDEPEIEPAFRDLLILYATAYSQYADEEPERQIDAFNRYMQRKREYQVFVNRNSNEVSQVRLI